MSRVPEGSKPTKTELPSNVIEPCFYCLARPKHGEVISWTGCCKKLTHMSCLLDAVGREKHRFTTKELPGPGSYECLGCGMRFMISQVEARLESIGYHVPSVLYSPVTGHPGDETQHSAEDRGKGRGGEATAAASASNRYVPIRPKPTTNTITVDQQAEYDAQAGYGARSGYGADTFYTGITLAPIRYSPESPVRHGVGIAGSSTQTAVATERQVTPHSPTGTRTTETAAKRISIQSLLSAEESEDEIDE